MSVCLTHYNHAEACPHCLWVLCHDLGQGIGKGKHSSGSSIGQSAAAIAAEACCTRLAQLSHLESAGIGCPSLEMS